MKKYLLIFTALLIAGVAGAETLVQRMAALRAVTFRAAHDEPVHVPQPWDNSEEYPYGRIENVHSTNVTYFVIEGNKVTINKVQLLIENYMPEAPAVESAYWVTVPEPLRPAPAETKFLTSRTQDGWGNLTAAQQKTAIRNFCNEVYEAANDGAGNIREFSVDPIDGTTIKVSGYFDKGTTWARESWYVRLLSANGSVATPYSNIEFQKIEPEVIE